jgi:tetratricopeptide (TPR) repeat protein
VVDKGAALDRMNSVNYFSPNQLYSEEAIQYYLRALDLDPNNILVLKNIAADTDHSPNHCEAMDYINRALAMDPHD